MLQTAPPESQFLQEGLPPDPPTPPHNTCTHTHTHRCTNTCTNTCTTHAPLVKSRLKLTQLRHMYNKTALTCLDKVISALPVGGRKEEQKNLCDCGQRYADKPKQPSGACSKWEDCCVFRLGVLVRAKNWTRKIITKGQLLSPFNRHCIPSESRRILAAPA